MAPKKRGPKKKRSAKDDELARLRRENQRLKKKLEHAEIALEVQKKLSELWGVTLEAPTDESDESNS